MFDIHDIISATKGRLIQGPPAGRVAGVSIDSRTLKKGDVFIAIKGERFDGHRFIRKAVQKGAVVLIVGRKIKAPKGVSVIHVKDTVKALGHLARFHRRRFSVPVVAITGSSGKTTVKEMIAGVLKTKYTVLKNVATQNNHIGVPLTLFRLNKKHEIVVLEFGTNRPGDIRWLTQIAAPDVAVLLNIGESHLEFLKTPAGVFREKLDIIRYAPAGVTAILNNDDLFLKTIAAGKIAKQAVTFSLNGKADYRAENVECRGFRRLEFSLRPGGRFSLKTPGLHNVYNAIAAISCGRHFKINYNDIKKALSSFSAPSGRQRFRSVGPWRIIDDTYNANPVSMRSAVETLRCLPARGKKVLVCADMLELGRGSEQLHRAAGRYAAEAHLDLVLTWGKKARWISVGAKEKDPRLAAFHCRSLELLCKKLTAYCRPEDVILIKGSRRTGMERIIDFLKKQKNP
jgi:UDP-N-acetylmuramoyl-tripeptide--D-alanyl-D-alanine ligase